MTLLKESEAIDELKLKYDQIWNNILHCEVSEAKRLVNGFAEQVNFHYIKKSETREFKDYLKTPYPYIAILVGIAIPVTAFLLILLLP
ncbi:hypothetical protein P4H94_18165 [Paenibacillus macerans]|uniref:Uncharacterized protein n=1 Tax=Paenibacillus macerans TaxID=44252 RepID=A0A090YQR8_PAEMA|nr:hypothetical protein [Paenibacillus macerans]KFM94465.1 hypothetical protein DJ90_1289 [Paenibacillus macerans]MBS5910118.1 hypothetical protein [Paenibacillus macerans]MCY7557847.1 hypothetical protein [Paenibacillus macerans]MDU5949594.1 hypothetical protein [Paenibacillus macerans]MEC0138778.1 hypothetical protein [Paenibacillus macerans]